MSKQITITVPDDILMVLEAASEESLRPLATEAVYQIKRGLKGATEQPKAKSREMVYFDLDDGNVPDEDSFGEEDSSVDPMDAIYEFCSRDFDQQFDDEDLRGLGAEAYELAKAAGVQVNVKQCYFWKKEGGNVVKLGSWK